MLISAVGDIVTRSIRVGIAMSAMSRTWYTATSLLLFPNLLMAKRMLQDAHRPVAGDMPETMGNVEPKRDPRWIGGFHERCRLRYGGPHRGPECLSGP